MGSDRQSRPNRSSSLSFQTFQTASTTIFFDILEDPVSRSVKTIGTSRMRTKARFERPRDGDRQPPVERLANHLEVEGEIRERFIEIQQDLFRTTRQHQQALHDLRSELRTEVASENPDPHRVEELLNEIGALHMNLDRAMVESVLATKKILDPGQQRRYFRVLERMREATRRFGDRSGRPGRPNDRRPPPPDRP